jgi:hypothetical protein
VKATSTLCEALENELAHVTRENTELKTKQAQLETALAATDPAQVVEGIAARPPLIPIGCGSGLMYSRCSLGPNCRRFITVMRLPLGSGAWNTMTRPAQGSRVR